MLADDVEALLEAGLKAYGNRDPETAARCWRRVLELQPDNEQAKDFLLTAGFELPPALAPVVDLDEARQRRTEVVSHVEPVETVLNETVREDGDAFSREAVRSKVERLVRERKLEAALDELDRARHRFPEDASISRSIRLLRDRLAFEYAKVLGSLDDIPRLVVAKEVIMKARPSAEEQALLKLIDGIASLGDIVRSSHAGRFETFQMLVRFLGRGWIEMRAPTGTWDPREFLPVEVFSQRARASESSSSAGPESQAPRSSPPHRLDSDETKPVPSSQPAAHATQNDDSEKFESLFREATAAYLRHDHAQAIELFSRCLQLRPDDRRVQYNLQRLQSRRNS